MIIYTHGFNEGFNPIIDADGNGALMQMDVAILKLSAGKSWQTCEEKKETAFLLLTGNVTFETDDGIFHSERKSEFDETPSCLHISKNTRALVTALKDSEIYVQRAYCDKVWAPRFYSPSEVRLTEPGKDVLEDTMHRCVRTIFDYTDAPNSNMVLGEVVNLPGRWSSYPPHFHPQPEAYYYRFDHPQGFGAGFVGENAYMLKNNSLLMISPNETHPQVTAPGYRMMTIWGIRHLDGDPWINTRTESPEHQWMMAPNAKIGR